MWKVRWLIHDLDLPDDVGKWMGQAAVSTGRNKIADQPPLGGLMTSSVNVDQRSLSGPTGNGLAEFNSRR